MNNALLMVGLALIFAPGVALAQPQQVQVPNEYLLKIKPVDVDKIAKGLYQLPYSDVADLIQSLREQVIQQQQPKPAEQQKPEPKKK